MRNLASRLQALRSSPGFVVFVVAFSIFTDMCLYGLIIPITPTAIVERGHARHEDREYWLSILLTSESAAALVTCPFAGLVADYSSRRQIPFLVGLLLLTASMLVIALAQSIPMFVIGRCLQGASTAVVTVSGMGMAIDAIHKDSVAVTLGWLGAASTAGFAVGPVLGGTIYSLGHWWGVFGFVFALLGFDLVLRLAVRESRRGIAVDEADGEAGTASETPLKPKTSLWDSFAFVKLLRYPRMIWMLWGVVAAGIVVSSFDVTLPIFVQSQFGFSPLGQGLIFVPTAIPSLLDPFYGYCINWFGIRWTALMSFLVLTPTLVCLRFVVGSTAFHIGLLVVLLGLISACVDAGDVALQVEADDVVRAITDEDPNAFSEKGALAQSFSLLTMAHYLGILIGPSWGGLIEFWKGWSAMCLSLGLLALVSAVAMTRVGGGWVPRTKDSGEHEEETEPLLHSAHGSSS